MSERSSTRRMFVAAMLGLELGRGVCDRVREALAGKSGELPSEGLRVYGAEDLHTTLFFLGAVEAEREAKLGHALELELANDPAPTLELTRAGAFPGRGRERVLWIGVREIGERRLARLQEKVSRVCVDLGFAADPRPWSPHLTVARVRQHQRGPAFRVPESFFEIDLGLGWKPSRVELVESLAGGAATAYRAVRTFPLAGEGGSMKGSPPV